MPTQTLGDCRAGWATPQLEDRRRKKAAGGSPDGLVEGRMLSPALAFPPRCLEASTASSVGTSNNYPASSGQNQSSMRLADGSRTRAEKQALGGHSSPPHLQGPQVTTSSMLAMHRLAQATHPDQSCCLRFCPQDHHLPSCQTCWERQSSGPCFHWGWLYNTSPKPGHF